MSGHLNVKVGDEVVYHGSHEAKRVTVTRVGRSLFDVEINGRDWSFRLKDGITNDAYNGTAPYVRTLEQEAELDHRLQIEEELKKTGVTVQRSLPLELLEKLAQVVREHTKSDPER